ncbi:MAG TPA: M56 family metallopeptidase [Planctomycetota bacterium]|nr:M56 family metallopeptidase [Planctomycetota bacterium]
MSWLVANTLVAGVLALLVMGVGRWLRPAPAAMHVLWLFVLLKLVLPPLFEVPIDVSWLRAETAVEPVVVPWEASAGLVDEAQPQTPALPAAALAPDPFTLGEVLLSAWGGGSVLFVGFLLLGVVRGHRRLRSLGPVPPWLAREVETLAARLGVRVPELLDDPAATSPCVWSLGSVRLVLPVRALAAASTKGRAAVLVHELAHLLRGDHWLAQLELVMASALWWHPLFWFARARLRLWAELACDAWAVASVPEATIDFATVLIEAVARPDSAVPGMTVLGARPAARAAFERRLTMILNENVPCRGSRAWWLPFTALGLGLFAVPVAAQEEEPPVRVEVRVNGKKVDQLSGEARRILLERLLREEEEEAAARPGKRKKSDDNQDPVAKKGPAKAGKNKKAVVLNDLELDDLDLEGLPDQIRSGLKAGFAEARKEILRDKDLRELGITDEVLDLLDNIGSGKGLDKQIDSVIKAAMKGAGSVIVKELQADGTLRDLGVHEDIGKFVNDLLEKGYDAEKMRDLAVRTAKSALNDARVEVLHDVDLKKLGIEKDVEGLLDNVISGKGNFNGNLQKIIDKAIKSALREAKEENEEEEEAEEAKPAPKKRLERKSKSRDEVIR